MATAGQDAMVEELLRTKGMLRKDRICQKVAEDVFDLEVSAVRA